MPSKLIPFALALLSLAIGFMLGRSGTVRRLLRRLFRRTSLDGDELDALYAAELYDRAAELCAKVLEQHPDDRTARMQHGLALTQLDRFDEAAGEFLRLVLSDASDIGACHQLAYCLFRSQMNHGALACMDHVTAAEPADAGLALSRADVLSEMGRREEARSVFESVRLARNDVDGRIALAICRGSAAMAEDRYEDAITFYEQALDLGCDDPECRVMISVSQQALGRPAEALDTVMKQIVLTPEAAACYMQAARLLQEQGDAAQALAYYEKASPLLPDPLHYERAVCLAALEQPEDALKELTALINDQSSVSRAFVEANAEKDFPTLRTAPEFTRLIRP